MKYPHVYKGITYFSTYESARDYAKTRGFPCDRIIGYNRGYAIQLMVSGPYVGPETIVPRSPFEIEFTLTR